VALDFNALMTSDDRIYYGKLAWAVLGQRSFASNLKICVHLRPSVVLLLSSKAQAMMRGVGEEGNHRWTRIEQKKARPVNAQRPTRSTLNSQH
jgi:hypothetical protein